MSSLHIWPTDNPDKATSTHTLSTSRNKSCPLSVSEDVWKEEEEETERGEEKEKTYRREGIFFLKDVIRDWLGAGTIAMWKGNRKVHL